MDVFDNGVRLTDHLAVTVADLEVHCGGVFDRTVPPRDQLCAAIRKTWPQVVAEARDSKVSPEVEYVAGLYDRVCDEACITKPGSFTDRTDVPWHDFYTAGCGDEARCEDAWVIAELYWRGWERDLRRGYKMGDMPGEWTRFWHLADQEYVQGGGWICVEEGAGRLVVIDLDQRDPIYLLNSSVRNFYTTLAHFLEWSEKTDGGTAATIRLRDALRRQDCVSPEELEPFWMNFIDATLDADPMRLAVSLSAKNA